MECAQRMRIVISCENFDPRTGYLEKHLAEELSKLGHEVFVLTFGGCRKVSRVILKDGFEVIYIPYVLKIAESFHLPSFDGIVYLIKFLKEKNPHIIHCQPVGSPLSTIFLLFKNVFGYKVVGSIATQLNVIFSPWNLTKKILFCLSKIVIASYAEKRTEVFFAKTRSLAKILSLSYGVSQDKFHIIPLGADPELFKFSHEARVSVRKKLGISEDDVVVVYSGKINYPKRLHILIEALAPIIRENPKVKLLIVGKGDARYIAFLRKLLIDMNIIENVIFHPWVDRKTLNSFYSASDIGVWPGLSSTSIIDAASNSLPLIIARYPVESYAVVNGNGFMFEIDNVKELRKYLEILIYNDKLRKEMGLRSRELVERKLNWKTITLLYLDAYTSVLGTRSEYRNREQKFKQNAWGRKRNL